MNANTRKITSMMTAVLFLASGLLTIALAFGPSVVAFDADPGDVTDTVTINVGVPIIEDWIIYEVASYPANASDTQVDPGTAMGITFTISDRAGIDLIDSINFTAFHDMGYIPVGDELTGPTPAQHGIGSASPNYNTFLSIEWSNTGTTCGSVVDLQDCGTISQAAWSVEGADDDEWTLDASSNVSRFDSTTIRGWLNFTQDTYSRWAPGQGWVMGSDASAATAYNDRWSWNFALEAADSVPVTPSTDAIYGEYGLYRLATLSVGPTTNPSGSSAPGAGVFTLTDGDITHMANTAFNLTIVVDENLFLGAAGGDCVAALATCLPGVNLDLHGTNITESSTASTNKDFGTVGGSGADQFTVDPNPGAPQPSDLTWIYGRDPAASPGAIGPDFHVYNQSFSTGDIVTTLHYLYSVPAGQADGVYNGFITYAYDYFDPAAETGGPYDSYIQDPGN